VANEDNRKTYMNELPEGLTTPDTVETSLGTLQFDDGVPTQDTADLLYDHLDLYRAVETFLVGMPAASLDGFRRGLASVGVDSSNKALLYDELMDSKPLFLTGNSSTVYVIAMLDLEKDGPTVIEVPAGTGPGVVNDAFFRNVTDLGPPGPDNGKGGRYVVYPPDYDGDYPKPGITGDWLFPVTSPTYVNLVILRGFIIDHGAETSNKIYREGFKIYPLAEASQPWQAEGTKGNPPPMEFISGTGLDLNTIHSNDFHFFEELHTVLDREPIEAIDPEMRGLYASIGIQKGKPFDPDDRMKRILTDAIKVANGTARSLLWYEREKSEFIYEGSYWKRGYVGDDWQYLKDDGMGGRNLDARTHFFYNATVNSPAMSNHLVHAGSQYAWGYRDSEGSILDGGKNYTLHLPKDVPQERFWSVAVYDNQSRSLLRTEQRYPTKASWRKNESLVNEKLDEYVANDDGSIDLYFGPEAPEGKEPNWIQTIPGKGWFCLFRLYNTLMPWYDHSWRLGEIELVE